jgi:hypothetical protein
MAKNKLDYTVVIEHSITDFRVVMHSYLNDGWIPVGNLSIVINQKGDPIFYQGLTKEVK